jgi:hypothetical protein
MSVLVIDKELEGDESGYIFDKLREFMVGNYGEEPAEIRVTNKTLTNLLGYHNTFVSMVIDENGKEYKFAGIPIKGGNLKWLTI